MSTASLGGAVPAPDDNSALDRLISAIEKLAGNRGGGGGRKGSTQSGGMSAEDMDKKLLAEQGKRYKLEMEIHRTTYDVLARLSKYRVGLEKQHTNAATKLAAQRSRALEAQARAQEKLTAENAKFDREGWQKAHNAAQALKANKRKQITDAQEFGRSLADKLNAGVNFTSSDLLKALYLNRTSTGGVQGIYGRAVSAIRGNLDRQRQEKLAAENAKFDREGMQTAHNAMAVYRAAKQKQAEKIAANDLKEEEQARDKAHNAFYALEKKREKQAKAEADALDKFQKGIGYKVKAGMNLTRGDLRQSMFLGSRYSDFIRNEIEQREAQKNGKVDEKKGGGWSSFFGGFARNLIIGKLYSAAHFALTPLMALGAGLSSGGVRVWGSLAEAAVEAGKQLYHLTGAGDAFTSAEYDLKTFSQRLKKINAREEMGFGLGAKASAGIVGAGSSLTRGVSDAFTNAIVNPLTGFTDIVNKIGHAVSLFDPSTMMRYNLVMRELSAVIGMTMTPVVQGITALLKEFGDYLKPLAQSLTPQISNMMKGLVEAIKPLVPLLIIELKEAIEAIIQALGKAGGGKLGLKQKILQAVGVPDEEVKDDMRGWMRIMGKAMVGAGIGALPGLAAGNPFVAAGGAVAGAAGGALQQGMLENQRVMGRDAARQAMVANAMNGLDKGNLMGTAVAHNATIGSGVDLARRAAQDAFIASSNNGLTGGDNLFEAAAKKAIAFFDNQGQGKNAVVGNAQPGMANGQGPIAKAGDLWGAFGGAIKAQLGFQP